MWLTNLLFACASEASSVGPPAVLLHEPAQLGVVELPASTRPADELEPAAVPLAGPWVVVRTVGSVDELAMPLPVRPLEFPARQAPLDLSVAGPAGAVPFESFDAATPTAGTWAVSGSNLLYRVPTGTPGPTDLALNCTRAFERERALHLATSGRAPAPFALRTLRLGSVSRTGLLLPPPGRATWEVAVPKGGVFTFDGTVLPPEVATGAASDGARVVVSVEAGGDKREVGRFDLAPDSWTPARVDLGAYAGRTVTVELRSEPGATDRLDHVFLAAPTVYTPSKKPRHVVLVLVDTLRPDHLGLYGYSRPTSPVLDAWAKGAVVFEQARSVAPWTLPSTRALLSSQHPERWSDVPSFPALFADRGYTPLAFTTNHFLTEDFGMSEGWAAFDYLGDVPAEVTIDRALTTLAGYPDRDVALLVHVMDPHVPYREPAALRHTWAGDDPAGLTGLFGKGEVDALRVFAMPEEQAAPIQQYMRDRYDQEILYTDGALKRLFDAAGPRDVVALVSDHGEEFWDHGGYEHGHTLYDELLHVPMVVKAPGIRPGRSDAAVSLLDVVPTLLELAGAPGEGFEGRSLVPLMEDRPGARAAIDTRVQVFGRKIYGRDRWGVLREGHKWVTSDGTQTLFDVYADPGERTDLAPGLALADLDVYRQAMAAALGRDVPYLWRLFTTPFREPSAAELRLRVTAPAGFTQAWRAYDWKGTKAGFVADISVTDGVVEVVQPAGQLAPAEIYLLPGGDALDPRGLSVTSDLGGATVEAVWALDRKPPVIRTDTQTPFAKAFNGDVRWVVDFAVAPVMGEPVTSDFNPESLEELRALGYVE